MAPTKPTGGNTKVAKATKASTDGVTKKRGTRDEEKLFRPRNHDGDYLPSGRWLCKDCDQEMDGTRHAISSHDTTKHGDNSAYKMDQTTGPGVTCEHDGCDKAPESWNRYYSHQRNQHAFSGKATVMKREFYVKQAQLKVDKAQADKEAAEDVLQAAKEALDQAKAAEASSGNAGASGTGAGTDASDVGAGASGTGTGASDTGAGASGAGASGAGASGTGTSGADTGASGAGAGASSTGTSDVGIGAFGADTGSSGSSASTSSA